MGRKNRVIREVFTRDLLRSYANLKYEPVRKLVYHQTPLTQEESQKLLNDIGDYYTLRNINKFENIAIHSLNAHSLDFTLYINIIHDALKRSRIEKKDYVIAYLEECYMQPPCLKKSDDEFCKKYKLSPFVFRKVQEILYTYVDEVLSLFIPNYKKICKIYRENLQKNRYEKSRRGKLTLEEELEIIQESFAEAMDKAIKKEERENEI